MNNLNASIIANSFLIKAFQEEINITPLKLNFLVYLLSSDYLLQTNNNLITEYFIKTPTGPVLLSLDADFGCFADKPIIKFSRDAIGEVHIISADNQPLNTLLSNIWHKYKHLSHDDIISYVYHANLSKKSETLEVLTNQEILTDAIKRNQKETTKISFPIKRRTTTH